MNCRPLLLGNDSSFYLLIYIQSALLTQMTVKAWTLLKNGIRIKQLTYQQHLHLRRKILTEIYHHYIPMGANETK